MNDCYQVKQNCQKKNKNNQIIVVAVAVAVVADNSLEVALQTFAQTGSMQG